MIITVILNTDTPATRQVDPICESLDKLGVADRHKLAVELVVDELVVDELTIHAIIIVTGDDLSLSHSTLLIVRTPYT